MLVPYVDMEARVDITPGRQFAREHMGAAEAVWVNRGVVVHSQYNGPILYEVCLWISL